MDINVSEECADSIFRLKPEDEGRRLLHNICTHLTSYKVSHSFRPLSCRDSLVKTSHITEWFLYSTVTRNKIHQQNGTVHITTAEAALLPGAFNKLTVTDQNKELTWLQRLDGNRRRVVPQALPHLAKLPMSQLAHKLQGTSFDLPLVSCAMRQATGHRLLNLHRHHHITAPRSTV